MKVVARFLSGLLQICRLSCLVLAALQSAYALDPTRSITEYRHDYWKQIPGLPQSIIRQILRTRDGYLWLATDGGLVRFDGVHFEAFTRRNTPAFRDHQILFLQEDRRGNLWASTYGGGLISRQDGKFLSLTTKDGLASDYVRSVVEDRRGHLWIVTDLAVSHWDGFRFVPVPEPLKTPRAGIVEDREGPCGSTPAGACGAFKVKS
jgi:ligand-binding sensor domain-containing protein